MSDNPFDDIKRNREDEKRKETEIRARRREIIENIRATYDGLVMDVLEHLRKSLYPEYHLGRDYNEGTPETFRWTIVEWINGEVTKSHPKLGVGIKFGDGYRPIGFYCGRYIWVYPIDKYSSKSEVITGLSREELIAGLKRLVASL